MRTQNKDESFEYYDVLFLYIAGILQKDENLRLSKIINHNQDLEFAVDYLQNVLVLLSESCAPKMPDNLKSRVLDNISSL